MVHVSDFAVIGTVSEFLLIRRGWFVRPMRVIIMDPAEELVFSVFLQPAGEPGKGLLSAPLCVKRLKGHFRPKSVVIDIEASVYPEPGVHGKGRDERRGGIAAFF
jgi:hypothetical protein